MKKNIYKKIVVFAVVISFLGMIIVPAMGAVNQKIGKNPTDLYKKSTTNNCQTFDLLIITPAQFEKELEPLVDHKNDVGVSTIIITLDELYEETYWAGRDEPEKIKYFIKTAADEWGIQYVLLVGDFKSLSYIMLTSMMKTVTFLAGIQMVMEFMENGLMMKCLKKLKVKISISILMFTLADLHVETNLK
jgi:hypothetical protein